MDPWTQIFTAHHGISVTPSRRPDSSPFDGLLCGRRSDGCRWDDVDEPYRDERIRSPLHWSIQARDDLAIEWLIEADHKARPGGL